jgi:hypothetical protein
MASPQENAKVSHPSWFVNYVIAKFLEDAGRANLTLCMDSRLLVQ